MDLLICRDVALQRLYDIIFIIMSLFKNKYRIKSTRLPEWNYASDGAYFVTICTKTKNNYFGHIVDGNMILNKFGQIAIQCWTAIPEHFSNIRLDEFVIMPNHIHGILIITKRRDVALQRLYNKMSKISPRAGSISTAIRSFKSIVTRTINADYPDLHFAWQPRFHDHIIRTEKSLNQIREYIIGNPTRWDLDKNNPNNNAGAQNFVPTNRKNNCYENINNKNHSA
ncbi:MAG: transposase [Candidatus Omnitrophica bacterium]|nr:transposase [Candidatus Omnitrophota bacterium]